MRNVSGEYSDGLSRQTIVQTNVYAAKTTARLKSEFPISSTASDPNNLTRVAIESDADVNNTDVTIQLVETDDIAAAGVRTNLGAAQTIKPGGRVSLSVYPTKRYIEVQSTAGTGFIRITLDSLIRWEKMSFSKTETIYPQKILQPQTLPAINNT